MSYLVLARKYRPQTFAELVGQEHVARTLTNAIEAQRVHHAFLFTGARGVGKTSAARILARALCCEKGPTAKPCGKCELCEAIKSGQSTDLFEIDAASNTQVDKTRELLEGARYLPSRARKKIYIIDEVHMLSTASFNALLKTLEEPPDHVVFILATTEVHKIPVTVLSRCQRFDFKLIPTARLEQHIAGILEAESIVMEPEAIRLVARQAAGSVRDALSLLDQVIAYAGKERVTRQQVADVLGVADRRLLVELLQGVLAHDAGAVLRLVSGAADRGLDLAQMAKALLAFLRDVEIAGSVADAADLVDATAEELADAQALAAKAEAGLLRVLFDRWARVIDEAARSLTPRLLYEMALVDLCLAEPLVPLGDLLERLEDLEARLRGGGGAPGRPSSSSRPATAVGPGVRTAGAPARESAGTAAREGASAGSRESASTAARASGAQAGARAPSAAGGGAARKASEPVEAWRMAMTHFQDKRQRLAGILAHAVLNEAGPGRLTLLFAEKYDADQAEKARAEIGEVLASCLGAPLQLTIGVGRADRPVARSEVEVDSEERASDRRRREEEAKAHPAIRRAQELFNASVREIKTE